MTTINLLCEIRTYRLHPGCINAFAQVMEGEAIPLLRKHGMDVIAWGRTQHEHESYFLVRAYRDVADLSTQQDAFYGSSAWREGPRERLVKHINTYLNTLLHLSSTSVEDMRQRNAAS